MRQKLTTDRLAESMSGLTGWGTNGEQISKEFEFEAYKDGLVFACAVGFFSDAMDHHPDLTIGYKRVTIQLSTHDAGGITETDIRLATKIESLVNF